jgi:hypothetical protein
MTKITSELAWDLEREAMAYYGWGMSIRFENSRQSQKSYIKPVLSIASSQATIELRQKRFV